MKTLIYVVAGLLAMIFVDAVSSPDHLCQKQNVYIELATCATRIADSPLQIVKCVTFIIVREVVTRLHTDGLIEDVVCHVLEWFKNFVRRIVLLN